MTELCPGTPKLLKSGNRPNLWVGLSQVQNYEHRLRSPSGCSGYRNVGCSQVKVSHLMIKKPRQSKQRKVPLKPQRSDFPFDLNSKFISHNGSFCTWKAKPQPFFLQGIRWWSVSQSLFQGPWEIMIFQIQLSVPFHLSQKHPQQLTWNTLHA